MTEADIEAKKGTQMTMRCFSSDWDRYAQCLCGRLFRAPFGEIFHIHHEVCPSCGEVKSNWLPVRTLRFVEGSVEEWSREKEGKGMEILKLKEIDEIRARLAACMVPTDAAPSDYASPEDVTFTHTLIYACTYKRDVAALLEELARLHDDLRTAVRISGEAFELWDADCEDQRLGKVLMALAGHLPGYRTDCDAIHKALR